MKYKVNKEKCVGCQVCLRNCPGATKIGDDGKAEVINQGKLEECGRESVCPMGAVEKISNGEETKQQETSSSSPSGLPPYGSPPPGERGLDRGRGMGAGRGRGLGIGPRDGRGAGRGGGRRSG